MTTETGIPQGYKLTDLGVIPEDWEVKKIKELFNLKNGVNSDIKHYGSGIKFINILEVLNNNSIRYEDIPGYISLSTETIKSYLVMNGDVLFNRTSETQEEIGLASVYFDEKEVVFGGFVIRARPIDNSIDDNYKKYIFLSSPVRKEIIKRGQGAIRANIGQNDLYKVQLPLPPLSEQKAIAGVLSDMDALIGSLEQLINKKRAVKQGTMQRLLSGQTRLPGFSGEWEEKKLGEIAEIISGGTPSTKIREYWNGKIKWATPTDITSCKGKYLSNTEKTISKRGLENSSATLLPIGSLLLCSRATIGEIRIAAVNICTNQGFKSLVCREEVNNEFLYYYLLQIKGKLMEKAIGSTFLEISKKDTALIEIFLPSLPEQQAIAEILSDMDQDIESLERKRDKYKVLKQGMMQELLTGKRRIKG